MSARRDLSAEAQELIMYADSEEKLSSQKTSIERNLLRKMKQGQYEHDKAPQGWMYWVDSASKAYGKEFGPTVGISQHFFSIEVRREAAQFAADRFAYEAKGGEHG